jgi:hypothetical protein
VHSTPCLLLCEKVNAFILPNILLVSLYPIVLCLYHFLALISIFLVFLSQRQCMMRYLTLVGGNLRNWKWWPWIKMGRGSWFHYRLVNRLLVANEFTWLNLIMLNQLKDWKLVWLLRVIHKHGIDYDEMFSPAAKFLMFVYLFHWVLIFRLALVSIGYQKCLFTWRLTWWSLYGAAI